MIKGYMVVHRCLIRSAIIQMDPPKKSIDPEEELSQLVGYLLEDLVEEVSKQMDDMEYLANEPRIGPWQPYGQPKMIFFKNEIHAYQPMVRRTIDS